jgi:surfeit locus 1 family protein
VDGLSKAPRGNAFQLAHDSSTGKVWQNVSVERFQDAFKLDLQPIIVEQASAADDGLVREWERPDFGIEKHRGYAFQWYSLAALTAVLYAVFSLRGAKKQGG